MCFAIIFGIARMAFGTIVLSEIGGGVQGKDKAVTQMVDLQCLEDLERLKRRRRTNIRLERELS